MLLDSNAVGGLGHAAAITGFGNNWRYDSYGPGGGDRFGQKGFNSKEEAMKYAASKNYTDWLSWETSPESVLRARSVADAMFKEVYEALANNCQIMVNQMADASDLMMYLGYRTPTKNFNANMDNADTRGKFCK